MKSSCFWVVRLCEFNWQDLFQNVFFFKSVCCMAQRKKICSKMCWFVFQAAWRATYRCETAGCPWQCRRDQLWDAPPLSWLLGEKNTWGWTCPNIHNMYIYIYDMRYIYIYIRYIYINGHFGYCNWSEQELLSFRKQKVMLSSGLRLWQVTTSHVFSGGRAATVRRLRAYFDARDVELRRAAVDALTTHAHPGGLRRIWCRCEHCGGMTCGTLPETNISPENGWLEYQFSFWDDLFSGAKTLVKREGR